MENADVLKALALLASLPWLVPLVRRLWRMVLAAADASEAAGSGGRGAERGGTHRNAAGDHPWESPFEERGLTNTLWSLGRRPVRPERRSFAPVGAARGRRR